MTDELRTKIEGLIAALLPEERAAVAGEVLSRVSPSEMVLDSVFAAFDEPLSYGHRTELANRYLPHRDD